MIIIDEAHHSSADSYKNYGLFRAKVMVGDEQATPDKRDTSRR